METTLSLHSLAERAADGTIDEKSTMLKFQGILRQYIAERSTEDETIAEAVHAVFDEHKGTSINMDAVASFALPKLNVQPENFNYLKGRVLDYVRANADLPEKKVDGKVVQAAEAPRTRAFAIGKGKGGGVRRWADVPEKPAAK